MVMPFLQLGIQTAYAQQHGGQMPTAPGPLQPYKGPFKDAAEDAQVKENDPTLHASQWKMWNRQAPMANAPARQAQQQGPSPESKQAFDGIVNRINTWAGQHKGYFAPDGSGKSPRMDAFLRHIAKFYGTLSPDQLDDTQLSHAFASFDPNYVQQFMAKQAAEENKRLQAENRQMHSESGVVRDSAPVKLDPQQEEMADLFGPDAF